MGVLKMKCGRIEDEVCMESVIIMLFAIFNLFVNEM